MWGVRLWKLAVATSIALVGSCGPERSSDGRNVVERYTGLYEVMFEHSAFYPGHIRQSWMLDRHGLGCKSAAERVLCNLPADEVMSTGVYLELTVEGAFEPAQEGGLLDWGTVQDGKLTVSRIVSARRIPHDAAVKVLEARQAS